MDGDALLSRSNLSRAEVQQMMANFEPLEGSFDSVAYSLENLTAEVDFSQLTSEGATADRRELQFCRSCECSHVWLGQEIRDRWQLVCSANVAR